MEQSRTIRRKRTWTWTGGEDGDWTRQDLVLMVSLKPPWTSLSSCPEGHAADLSSRVDPTSSLSFHAEVFTDLVRGLFGMITIKDRKSQGASIISDQFEALKAELLRDIWCCENKETFQTAFSLVRKRQVSMRRRTADKWGRRRRRWPPWEPADLLPQKISKVKPAGTSWCGCVGGNLMTWLHPSIAAAQTQTSELWSDWPRLLGTFWGIQTPQVLQDGFSHRPQNQNQTERRHNLFPHFKHLRLHLFDPTIVLYFYLNVLFLFLNHHIINKLIINYIKSLI